MLYRRQCAANADRDSIRIEPYFANACVNLAYLYRARNKGRQSVKLLEVAVNIIPGDVLIPFSLELTYVRENQKARATDYLAKATLLAPENAHYHYVLVLQVLLRGIDV